MSNADVVLDTYPYGGCLTALDALSNGVPIVVLPGPMERGRHAMSIYRQMGVMDFVADTADDYAIDRRPRTIAFLSREHARDPSQVRIAVALATDETAHADAVDKIRARSKQTAPPIARKRAHSQPHHTPRYPEAHQAGLVAREWADAFLRMERSAI